jgi:hypothetical protein
MPLLPLTTYPNHRVHGQGGNLDYYISVTAFWMCQSCDTMCRRPHAGPCSVTYSWPLSSSLRWRLNTNFVWSFAWGLRWRRQASVPWPKNDSESLWKQRSIPTSEQRPREHPPLVRAQLAGMAAAIPSCDAFGSSPTMTTCTPKIL